MISTTVLYIIAHSPAVDSRQSIQLPTYDIAASCRRKHKKTIYIFTLSLHCYCCLFMLIFYIISQRFTLISLRFIFNLFANEIFILYFSRNAREILCINLCVQMFMDRLPKCKLIANYLTFLKKVPKPIENSGRCSSTAKID